MSNNREAIKDHWVVQELWKPTGRSDHRPKTEQSEHPVRIITEGCEKKYVTVFKSTIS